MVLEISMKNKECGYWIIFGLPAKRTLFRRVMIPKPKGGSRPLGRPTMYDRALQALFVMALEPEFEATFE